MAAVHSLLASLAQAARKALGHGLRLLVLEDLLRSGRVRCPSQRATLLPQILQVHLAKLSPKPTPEHFDWVQIRTLRRYTPLLDPPGPISRHALNCSEEAFPITKNSPWPCLFVGVQESKRLAENATADSLRPLFLVRLLIVEVPQNWRKAVL